MAASQVRSLAAQKTTVLRGKVPRPGSVEAVIADRYDRKIADVYVSHGLPAPNGDID